MKKLLFRAMTVTLILGLAGGIISWLVGSWMTTYKPLAPQSHPEEKDPVIQGLEASGAQFLELNLKGWAQINKQYLSKNELAEAGGLLANSFADQVKFVKVSEEGQGWRFMQYKLEGGPEYSQPRIQINLQTREVKGQSRGETYLTVNISLKSLKEYQNFRIKLDRTFKVFPKKDRQVSTTVTGWYQAVLSAKELESIADKTLDIAGAKVVEGIGETNFVSISGYTPKIAESIRINDRQINFNVGLRANQVDKKTYLFIGTPLITQEY